MEISVSMSFTLNRSISQLQAQYNVTDD